LVSQIVAEIQFRRIPVGVIHEIFAVVIGAGLHAERGLGVFHGVPSGASAEDGAEIEILEAVVFILVGSSEEELGIEIAVVAPTAANGAGGSAIDVVRQGAGVDLVEVHGDLVVQSGAG